MSVSGITSLLLFNSKATITMEKIIKKQIKILPLAAIAALSFTSAAHGSINLDFVYDAGTNVTTVTYSGVWGVNSTSNQTLAAQYFDNGEMYSADSLADTGVYDTSGIVTATPWKELTTAVTRSGDNFGFSSSKLYGPESFAVGTTIAGSLQFGENLAEMGFSANDITTGFGQLLGEGVEVNWTAVPEHSSYAAVFGLVSVAAIGFRRRRS
jgi:hypothetical protein